MLNLFTSIIGIELKPLSDSQIFDAEVNMVAIILSICFGFLTSATVLALFDRAVSSQSSYRQKLWLGLLSSTLSIGIFGLHSLGLLSIEHSTPVNYDFLVLVASVFPLFASCYLALSILVYFKQVIYKTIVSGVALACGILLMHYISANSIQANAYIAYDLSLLILSVFIILTMSIIITSFIADNMAPKPSSFFSKKQSYSALLVGITLPMIAYATMPATTYYKIDETVFESIAPINQSALIFIFSFSILLILSVILAFTLHSKSTKIFARLRDKESELKISAKAFQSHNGILICDASAKVLSMNHALVELLGYSELDIIGKPMHNLHKLTHTDEVLDIAKTKLSHSLKWSGEVWYTNKEQKQLPVLQTINAIRDERTLQITHYVVSFTDISQQKNAEEKVYRLAYFDELTQLPNRRKFYETLDKELKISSLADLRGILIFFDLDHFKDINDSLGHSYGDAILVNVAKRLNKILRGTDLAVRLGGDEFVILVDASKRDLNQILTQADILADKVLKALEAPFYVEGETLSISASIGITIYSKDNNESEELLKQADTAMYAAKEGGRNRVCFYDDSMKQSANERLTLTQDLLAAVANNEFNVHLQPQFDLNKKLVGLEALARWYSKKGLIYPNNFIPLAEESDAIISIGNNVIRKAIEAYQSISSDLPDDTFLSINISSKQFFHPDFSASLIHTLKEYSMSPNLITLEVTESLFLEHMDEAVAVMKRLKVMGIKIALDDFGTGYSSLTYLKHLPLDELKIDRAFIKDLSENNADASLVHTIIELAAKFKLFVVVEGVETQLQFDLLSQYKDIAVQGYYFSRPLPAKELLVEIAKVSKEPKIKQI